MFYIAVSSIEVKHFPPEGISTVLGGDIMEFGGGIWTSIKTILCTESQSVRVVHIYAQVQHLNSSETFNIFTGLQQIFRLGSPCYVLPRKRAHGTLGLGHIFLTKYLKEVCYFVNKLFSGALTFNRGSIFISSQLRL